MTSQSRVLVTGGSGFVGVHCLLHATNEKARRVLGWTPRSNEEAIVATAESLARFGLLKR